jgi:hypothetical protein
MGSRTALISDAVTSERDETVRAAATIAVFLPDDSRSVERYGCLTTYFWRLGPSLNTRAAIHRRRLQEDDERNSMRSLGARSG